MTTYQRLVRTMALGFILAVITAASGFAQTSLASLRGKVSDEQGGVLPGATVTVRQIETNATKVGVTGEARPVLPAEPAGGHLRGDRGALGVCHGETDRRRPARRAGGRYGFRPQGRRGPGERDGQPGSRRSSRRSTWSARSSTRKSVENLPTVSRNFADLAQLAPGRQLHRRIVDGILGGRTASVPEQRVRRRRDQRDAVLRDAVRVVSAGLDPGIPGDDERVLGRVRERVGRRAERHHAERHQHAPGTGLRLLPEREVQQPARTPDASSTARRCSSTTTPIFNQRRLGGYLGGPIVTNTDVLLRRRREPRQRCDDEPVDLRLLAQSGHTRRSFRPAT